MHQIHRLDVVDSTMNYAAGLAASGAPDGTVVVADEQTGGQGRAGHAWHSERHSGLYMSEIVRRTFPTDSLPLVMITLGLATAEAITKIAGVACDLRWPNDVLIGARKCAGILVQLHDKALILGIGINVNHAYFNPGLANLATSLYIATGREYSREHLLAELIASIDVHLDTLLHRGKEAIIHAFVRASSYAMGRRVTVDQGTSILEGVTDGLDPHGFLVVQQDNGVRTLVLAGGVRPACS